MNKPLSITTIALSIVFIVLSSWAFACIASLLWNIIALGINANAHQIQPITAWAAFLLLYMSSLVVRLAFVGTVTVSKKEDESA